MGYLDDFEASLLDAAERVTPQQRRRRTFLPAAAAILIVLGFVGLAFRPEQASASTITVRRGADVLTVRILEPEADPEQILRDLRDAGLEVRMELAPTGPSEVGRFLGLSVVGSGRRGVPGTEVQVPVRWRGVFVLSEAVAARPGEAYVEPTDAFAAREPLACLAPGATAARLGEVAARRGLVVRWQSADGTIVADPPAGAVAVQATATAADHVTVRFGPPGGRVPPEGDRC